MSSRAGLDRILELIVGYRQAKCLTAAAYLELFAGLERPASAARVAGRKRLDPRATEILLDALAAMGLLEKRGRLYRNRPIAARHLVPGRPGYFGDNLKFQEIIWDAWGDLRAALRRGGAVRPLGYWLGRHPGFTREYIRGMANIARRPAALIAAAAGSAGPARLLDVGAGPGAYARAVLRANPLARADLLDLPGTLRETRRLLARAPERRRMRFLPADYRRASFGRGLYDLVLMSHVTHDESPEVNAALARKAFAALRPGGRVLVHDFMVDDTRTRPLFGALFSAHMLVYTEGGRAYTEREYRGWLERAGFSAGRSRPVGPAAPNATRLLVGRKP